MSYDFELITTRTEQLETEASAVWLEIQRLEGRLKELEGCEDAALSLDLNLTYNLHRMAEWCGMGDGGLKALAGKTPPEAAEMCRAALRHLRSHWQEAARYDSPNGWGAREDFRSWLERAERAFSGADPSKRVRVS